MNPTISQDAPGRIRTCDPQIRSHFLREAETALINAESLRTHIRSVIWTALQPSGMCVDVRSTSLACCQDCCQGVAA